jgi:hypothetical protein
MNGDIEAAVLIVKIVKARVRLNGLEPASASTCSGTSTESPGLRSRYRTGLVQLVRLLSALVAPGAAGKLERVGTASTANDESGAGVSGTCQIA